jgi:diaminohydroxyphosphoribosylaminopyrimidine deaminase / 5-amino-6-(5-phosphoribosylamino)uracil reductase
MTSRDEYYMDTGLRLASRARGLTSPNPMVGAVLVKNDHIIAKAFHRRAGEDHAERAALKKAGIEAEGSTLYVTLEPCCHYGKTPPCTDIIIESGVKKVIVAVRDPFPEVSGKGIELLKKAGIEVEENVLSHKARRLNEAFFTYHEKKRPFITLKWAMSLDGRCSTDNSDSIWITSPESRRYSHKLRGYHDAVVAGIGTILTDDPRFTVRIPGYRGKQPSCIILDTNLRTPAGAKIFNEDHKVYIACGKLKNSADKKKAIELKSRGARILTVKKGKDGKIDISALLQELYKEGIQSIYVEGGRNVAGAFFKSGYTDKISAFTAPVIIGGKLCTSPLLFDGPETVKNCIKLEECRIQRIGPDFLIEGYIGKKL